ncbi:IclR family transcriptional regulator [Bordetella sp. BOR01]|uniref:IclR family transcriptional regulator n=1 Tax=Bordetella sp. BOR01 TaxID=2854779 RepID=UPI001C47CC1D|nr:IclR family transcriptional regulator [Bordetella sp. BOR01]MBV7486965.1 IclR family transcriptional regulator [Bordetella sp. BOR01]
MDNSMPALQRAIGVIEYLEQSPGGSDVASIAAATGVPRATLYRILRVLKAHGFVADAADQPGTVVLGSALARLGAQVASPRNLPSVAQSVMAALSERLGETVKLVVREGDEAVTLAVSQPTNDMHVASRIGGRLPLWLGASQRLLLAYAPQEVVDRVLAAPHQRRASNTITDAAQLRAELGTLRERGWACSVNEGVEGVGAAAAVVCGADGQVLAAVVAVYIYAGTQQARQEAIRIETIDAAAAISRSLGARVKVPSP